jgi:hypothetical protein
VQGWAASDKRLTIRNVTENHDCARESAVATLRFGAQGDDRSTSLTPWVFAVSWQQRRSALPEAPEADTRNTSSNTLCWPHVRRTARGMLLLDLVIDGAGDWLAAIG